MNKEEMLKKIISYSDSWEEKDFNSVLHTLYPVNMAPIMPMRENIGFSFKTDVAVFEKDQAEWFWAKKDLDKIRQLVIRKGLKDKSFIDNIHSKWNDYRLRLESSHKRLLSADLSLLSDKELLSAYESIYKPYINESSIGYIADAMSINSEVWLKEELEKDAGKPLDGDFSAFIAFEFDTFVSSERKDLLKILAYVQKSSIKGILDDKKSKNLLKQHSRKYFWILNNYARSFCLDEGYFAGKIKEMMDEEVNADRELERIKKEKEGHKTKKRNLIRKYNFSKKAIFMLEIFEVFGRMLDLRKRCVLISNHHFFNFIDEISRRIGIKKGLLNYCVYPELKDILSGKNKERWAKIFERRSERVAVLCLGNNSLITTEEVDRSPFYSRIASLSEVRGAVAFRGKVRGVCRILLNPNKINEVKKGDIIIASNTTPEYVSALERASAFVTDLGGITSHAAVVAREMKKPCIIGTKVGTKIFKDGDLVEVDAENGVVRKIKK
ncbi:MAG TPA: PEP-utilizing enzyme [Candidatus Nanoarchaeia archaeon]|nr:PEP-utilizing enzyme [Candidatus Nanoarchaeia archaeon]